ncbi:unnamed protein product [Acidocella sp. C78]|nr:unnamed protein product [Acidocella sp. C78]
MSPPLQDVAFGRALVGLGAAPASKDAAIAAAARLLEDAGCIAPGYTRSMLRREAVTGTFLGHGVAIPHGMGEDRHLVRCDGIAVLQVPGGVAWGAGQVARLIVAIAARGDAHIAILRRLAALMQSPDRLAALAATTAAEEIVEALAGEAAGPAAPAAAADFAHRFDMVVEDPAGLHARPAAAWAEAARQSGLRVRVRHGEAVADGRNLVALLHLGLRAGDRVVISAEGENAAAGLARLRARLAAPAAPAVVRAPTPAASARGWTPPEPLAAIGGIAASPGLAIGRLHVVAGGAAEIADEPLALAESGMRLDAALAAARGELHDLAAATEARLGAGEAAIFRA